MTTDLSYAWVLHKRLSGDTSAWVTFFTYHSGLVTAFFKGGLKPKKASLLQSFTPLYLFYDSKRDLRYVKQLEFAAKPIILTGEALFAGLYVNELIYYLLHENEPAPELFERFGFILEQLSHSPSRLETAVILRCFERALLHYCGYEILLSHDSQGVAIDAQLSYRYLAGEGLRIHPQGFKGAALQAIARECWQGPEVLRVAKQLFQQALDHALAGRVIQARALYYAYLKE